MCTAHTSALAHIETVHLLWIFNSGKKIPKKLSTENFNILVASVCSPCAGLLVLSASKTEDKDNLWLVDPDLFPFHNTLIESHVSLHTTILFTPL